MSTSTHRPVKARRIRSIRATHALRDPSARRSARASRHRSARETLLRRSRPSSRSPLFEVCTWVEARCVGKLPIQLTLALIDDRWYRDLHVSVEMARGSIGPLQAAPAEPQLLARTGAGRYLERDGSCRCRHLNARAQHGFPRRERKIHIEIEALRAIERMRVDVDIEIQIAVAAAA